jgi:glycosyltransferase involved in cell wall biosynthesis
MRFHVLGIPHTATNKDWLCCAFTQKVLKLCAMLKAHGHHVIHYGNAASEVVCDEHVTVTWLKDLAPPKYYLEFEMEGPAYKMFFRNAIQAINERKKPHDFLLCMWGLGHKPVADAHPELIVVEPGIGYAGGHFAPFKVFESYAMFHAYYGLETVSRADRLRWYDVIIPNYYDPSDFLFQDTKSDYLLFLGRVTPGKGINIAVDVAHATNTRLIVAGPGTPFEMEGVEYVGPVDENKRRHLLANARALIAPSIYLEPFCGVITEAHFSGTPVISTDWGAAAENNPHGITGYRCRTHEHFTWAIQNIDRVSPFDCRAFAEDNFSMVRVGEMYEEYFRAVMDIFTGAGWYEPNPGRGNLDWLTRRYPSKR